MLVVFVGVVVTALFLLWFSGSQRPLLLSTSEDVLYRSELYGYRVLVPASWTIFEEPSQPNVLLRDPYHGALVTIVSESDARFSDSAVRSSVFAEREAAYATGDLVEQLHFFDYEMVNGYPGYVAGGTVTSGDPEVRWYEVGLVSGATLWIVRADYELTAGAGYKGVVDTIIASFVPGS